MAGQLIGYSCEGWSWLPRYLRHAKVLPHCGMHTHSTEAPSRGPPLAPGTGTRFGTFDTLDTMDDETRNASQQPHRSDPLDKGCHLRLLGLRVARVLNRQHDSNFIGWQTDLWWLTSFSVPSGGTSWVQNNSRRQGQCRRRVGEKP